VYTLGTALQLGAAALAIPAATRLLGSAEFGDVALAISAQTLLIQVAGLGLPLAILRFYFDPADSLDGDARARALIVSTAVVAGAVVAVALLTGIAWAPALDPASPDTLLVAVSLAFPGAVIGACMGLLRAQERSRAFVVVALTASVGAQFLGIGGLLLDPEPLSYVAGFGVGVIAAAVAALNLTGAWRSRPASRQTLRSALRFSLPTVPNTVSVFVLAVGDRFVIQVISGLSAVGKYQIAYAFGTIGNALLIALQNAWMPITFGATEGRRWVSLADTAATVTRLTAYTCGFLALVADAAFSVIVPSSYSPHLIADVAALVALTSLPVAAYLSRSQVLYWTKHTRPLLWITPPTAAFNLMLVAVLLPPFGLRGAAAASVIAIFAQAVLTQWAAGRVAPVPWRLRRDLASYVIAAASVALALLLPHDAIGTTIRLLGATVCGVAFLVSVIDELRSGPPDLGPTGTRVGSGVVEGSVIAERK
jgi:O-antigen/teichoic acid export membrane protein